MLTHNEHLKFGWGAGAFNFEEKRLGSFWLKESALERQPGTIRQEAVLAAKLIGEAAPKRVAVMLSGGIGSEAVARSFIEAGVDFDVIVAHYHYRGKGRINSYETSHALAFAQEHDLKVHEVEVGLVQFLVETYPILANRYTAVDPTWLLYGHVMSRFMHTRHVVAGGGDPQLLRRAFIADFNAPPGTPSDGLVVEEKPAQVTPWECFATVNGTCSPLFWRHTSELTAAWLDDEATRQYIRTERSLVAYQRRTLTQMSCYHLKAWLIHKHWPEVMPRETHNGFELAFSWHYVPGTKTGLSGIHERPDYETVRRALTDAHAKYADRDRSLLTPVGDLLAQLNP